MIPYFEQPVIHFKGQHLGAFSVAFVLALIVGVVVAERRSSWAGLPELRSGWTALLVVAGGLIGAHLMNIFAYKPELIRTDTLDWLVTYSGVSSVGGIIGGLLTFAVIARVQRWPRGEVLIFIDSLALAFSFAMIFGRTGCALAHDHLGPLSTSFWAVDFPSGPRLDLGLLELIGFLPLSAALLMLNQRKFEAGTLMAIWLLIYGSFRFVLDFLRIDDARYAGLTPAQYATLGFVAAGFLLSISLGRAARARRAPQLTGSPRGIRP